jgi:hypothetical protein
MKVMSLSLSLSALQILSCNRSFCWSGWLRHDIGSTLLFAGVEFDKIGRDRLAESCCRLIVCIRLMTWTQASKEAKMYHPFFLLWHLGVGSNAMTLSLSLPSSLLCNDFHLHVFVLFGEIRRGSESMSRGGLDTTTYMTLDDALMKLRITRHKTSVHG